MKVLLALLMLVFVSPAYADNMAVLSSVCSMKAAFVSDGSAEYTADPNVVSADLNAPLIASLPAIEIPIELDLLERFNIDLPPGFDLEPDVSSLTVHMDGRIEFNGRDITANVNNLCSKAAEVKHYNGQPSLDSLGLAPEIKGLIEGVYTDKPTEEETVKEQTESKNGQEE